MKDNKKVVAIGIVIACAIVVTFFIVFWNDYGEIPVSEMMWVNVMNLNGVKNLNCRFEFMDPGLITKGAKIKCLAEYKDQVLVLYITPNYSAYGTELPAGTIFFIPKERFIVMAKS